MIKEVLMAVEDRLKEVKELAYIDVDWGQGDKQRPAVKFPACLIGLNRENVEQQFLARGLESKYEISVKLLTITLNRDDKFKQYDLVEQVKDILHSKHIEYFYIIYEGCQMYTREDDVKEIVMNFGATIGYWQKQEPCKVIGINVDYER